MPSLKGFPRVFHARNGDDFIGIICQAADTDQMVTSAYKKANLQIACSSDGATGIKTLTLHRLDSNEVLVTATTGQYNEAAFDDVGIDINAYDAKDLLRLAADILLTYRP